VRRSRALAAIAVAAVGAASFAIASAIGSAGDERAESDGLTRSSERRLVASGRSDELGRWEIVAGHSDRGPCLGLRLLDSGTAPALYEGCGVDPAFHVASLNGARETLLYGRLPEGTADVVIRAAGRPAERGRAIGADDGGGPALATSIGPGARGVVVEARDGRGGRIGETAVPTPGD
jgi:hypothetical protein